MTTAALFSWITALAAVIGMWLGGYNPRWGWIYGMANQILWVIYGLVTNQPGMIALSFLYVVLYVRNLRRWKGTQFQPAQPQKG